MNEDLNQPGMPETYEQPEPVAAPEPVEAKPQQNSNAEANFRILRERAEAAERRARELEAQVYQNMTQQQSTKMQLVEDDDLGLDDDSYIEGKHYKKAYKKQRQEIESLKKEQAEKNAKIEESLAAWRLRSEHTDFDAVVSQENLTKLAQVKPTLYKELIKNPDLYEKGQAAYDLVRAFVPAQEFADIDKRIEENKSKPRSAGSTSGQVAETPLARVGDYDRRVLTEERKKQLRDQVAKARRFS